MVRLISCSIILSFGVSQAYSQPADRQIVNQPLEWFSVTTNLKLNKTFSLVGEGQFRFVGDLEPMQFQVRTAVEIKLTDHFSFVPAGYVYTWNDKYGKQPTTYVNNEHRFWQQIFYKHSLGKFKVDHRVRVEERFIQSHSTNTEGIVVDEGYTNKQFRFRYRLMAKMPFGEKIVPKSYFASVYDEVFVSRGEHVTYYDPDQNRVFAGIGYQFNSSMSMQAGFLYQMLVKSNGAKQENNLGLQVMLSYNLDFTKSSN